MIEFMRLLRQIKIGTGIYRLYRYSLDYTVAVLKYIQKTQNNITIVSLYFVYVLLQNITQRICLINLIAFVRTKLYIYTIHTPS